MRPIYLNLLLERPPLIHLRYKSETTGVHLQTGVKYLQQTRVFQGGNLESLVKTSRAHARMDARDTA